MYLIILMICGCSGPSIRRTGRLVGVVLQPRGSVVLVVWSVEIFRVYLWDGLGLSANVVASLGWCLW